VRIVLVVLLVVGACGKREDERPLQQTAAPAVKPRPGCEKPGGAVCVDEDVVECRSDGSLGTHLARCDGGCSAGKCVETCALQDSELVYVVDSNHKLQSFDPRKLPNDPFHTVGKLGCDARSSPFSMAVDRRGIAWVNYHSGAVYRVSIIDGRCMQARIPENAPHEFGMGFVSDGDQHETLYVTAYDDARFAELDITQKAPQWKPLGRFVTSKNPELTGTSNNELFGFFPEEGDGFVQQIDRATGKLLGKRMPVGSPRGALGGWAFAHWGGKFYVFVTVNDNSMVYEVDRKTGASKRILDQLASRIVGAGVSTCAPLLESVAP
jgi:hypothetical protein